MVVGQTLSHYRIVEKLGAGGMGEVYLAEDTRLGREVAIKILPEAFTSDPERLARFEREAKVLASLNHPHIAQIHGLEDVDGQRFLVLELVEGPTLAERTKQGPIPVDEALPLAIQIAEALEAAHEKGIVHRDLKPANINLTLDGEVKVLDFGLAKPVEVAGSPDLTHSPTLTYAPTQAGVLLGTAAYMSPEQVRGQKVDKRSDIWAFGVVLWEMLTGRRLFKGETVSDVLAAVLQKDVELKELPRVTPRPVHHLLRRCMTRDLRKRLHDIADARLELEDAVSEPTPAEESAGPPPRWRRILLWALIPAALLAGWALRSRSPSEVARALRTEISLPPGERLTSEYRHGLAFSPDGSLLAFVSGTKSSIYADPDRTQIHLRPIDQWQARTVEGTENGTQPFFSPDGKWLGFVTFQDPWLLKKVPVAGGETVTICECDARFGAAWGLDESIIFGSFNGGLQRVPASGGQPESLTHPQAGVGEVSHRLPHVLPDGKAVLFTELPRTPIFDWAQARIYVHLLKTGERKLLIEGGADARYVPTGHLIFAREGRLMAVRFDVDRLEVIGRPVPLIEALSHSIYSGRTDMDTGAAQFSVSSSGLLAYVAGSVFPEQKVSVVLVDRNGRTEPLVTEQKWFLQVRLSSDARQALLTTAYPPWVVWLFDMERRTLSRQTFAGHTARAIWGPGNDHFTFGSDREPEGIYVKTVGSGPGVVERLPVEGDANPGAWSPDGSRLAFLRWNNEGNYGIWILSQDGGSEPFVESRFHESYPEFSPDGQWLVYTSDETGRNEVYVRPSSGEGPAIQISTRGGREPAWSRDGREIFYEMDDEFFAAEVRVVGGNLTPGQPVKLFEAGRYSGSLTVRSYDVTPEGKFILIKRPDEAALAAQVEEVFPDRIQVVQNWFAELKEKVP